jgi:ubiquinone/menaquinone biosynthesis C-methylase UbiE
MKNNNIKEFVKERYGTIANKSSSCCGSQSTCCSLAPSESISQKIGYSKEEINAVPEDANLGLGCGNPLAIAGLKTGETVLDLGSGAGFDCFLAAKKISPSGKVIGVDMTKEMIDKARKNARDHDFENVEFRLGEIENLPVDARSVDVIISNCVINLSPDKPRVFKEAFRVLKPGGRLIVADIVLTKNLPPRIKDSVEAYVGCIGGAVLKEEYLKAIANAGFDDIEVIDAVPFNIDLVLSDPGAQAVLHDIELSDEEAKELAKTIESIRVSGIKPVS